MKRTCSAPWLLLALVLTGCSPGYEVGQQAYDAGEYDKALEIWRPLAERGDARAQYGVGYLYDKGLGVPSDATEALHWYRQAAEQDNAEAQYELAVLYHTAREGWTQDLERAGEWYLRAAEQGNLAAQFMVGRMYFRGQGLPRNLELAAEWLTRCAEQRDTSCMNLLGILYRDGRGIEADPARAVHLICQAAQRGDAGALLNMATSHLRGVGAPQDFVEALRWHTIYEAVSGKSGGLPMDWVGNNMSEEQVLQAREQAGGWERTEDADEAARRCEAYRPPD